MKKLILALLFVLVPSLTLAATIKTGDTVEVNSNDKNAYAFSQNINITSNLTGDAVLFGQSINIDKNVEQSLFAFAQSINISGDVGQSVRSAGNTITITGTVGEDVLAGANALTISNNANIQGDLIAGAATVNISGTVDGNAKIAGAKVIISGKILGDADIHAKELVVENSAEIGGELTYWSEQVGNISSEAQIAKGPNFNEVRTDYSKMSTSIAYSILSLLIFALVMTYGFRRFNEKIKTGDSASFLRNFGWGLLMLGAVPLAGFILFAVSLQLGFTVLLAYTLSLIVAYAVSAIYTGVIVQKAISKEKDFNIDWVTAIIGGLVFILVGYVPFIGSTIQMIVFIASFGYIINKVYGIISSQSAKIKSSK